MCFVFALHAMARQKKSNNFSKLLQASQQVGATTWKPWRVQAKCVTIKLTSGQKAERKKKCAAQKLSYKEALLEVHQQVYKAAEEIHEQFLHLPVDHIVTDIFQSERLQSATKDVGRYSVFVSLESKHLNAGEFYLFEYFFTLSCQQRLLKVSPIEKYMRCHQKLQPSGGQCLKRKKMKLQKRNLHISMTVKPIKRLGSIKYLLLPKMPF